MKPKKDITIYVIAPKTKFSSARMGSGLKDNRCPVGIVDKKIIT